jgi:hypothetical protein
MLAKSLNHADIEYIKFKVTIWDQLFLRNTEFSMKNHATNTGGQLNLWV